MTATTATPRLNNESSEPTREGAEMTIFNLDQILPEREDMLSTLSGAITVTDKDLATATYLKSEMERLHGTSEGFDSVIFVGIKVASPSFLSGAYTMHNLWGYFKAQAEGVSTSRETHFIECTSDGVELSPEPVRFALVNPARKDDCTYVGTHVTEENRADPLIVHFSSGENGAIVRGVNFNSREIIEGDRLVTMPNRCWVKRDTSSWIVPPAYEELSALLGEDSDTRTGLMATKLVVTHSLARIQSAEILAGQRYLISYPDSGLYAGCVDTDGDIYNARRVTSVSSDGKWVKTERVSSYVRVDRNATFYSLPSNWGFMDAGVVAKHKEMPSATIEEMDKELSDLAERWDKMNEALNEYADEEDYCSEFEDSVIPLGFDGRDNQRNVDFDVDLTVRWSAEVSLDGGSDMNRIREIMGDSRIDDAELTINGTSTVSITVSAPRNGGSEGISEEIEHSMIEEALNFDYSIDIDDYDIDDWQEQ